MDGWHNIPTGLQNPTKRIDIFVVFSCTLVKHFSTRVAISWGTSASSLRLDALSPGTPEVSKSSKFAFDISENTEATWWFGAGGSTAAVERPPGWTYSTAIWFGFSLKHSRKLEVMTTVWMGYLMHLHCPLADFQTRAPDPLRWKFASPPSDYLQSVSLHGVRRRLLHQNLSLRLFPLPSKSLL